MHPQSPKNWEPSPCVEVSSGHPLHPVAPRSGAAAAGVDSKQILKVDHGQRRRPLTVPTPKSATNVRPRFRNYPAIKLCFPNPTIDYPRASFCFLYPHARLEILVYFHTLNQMNLKIKFLNRGVDGNRIQVQGTCLILVFCHSTPFAGDAAFFILVLSFLARNALNGRA